MISPCGEGMAAEARGDDAEAARLFQQAWETASDDYESCVAAHYVARHQKDPRGALRWNQRCLELADRVGDERVAAFYPSLHGNLARANAELGDHAAERKHFELAAAHLGELPPGQYGDRVRRWIAEGLRGPGTAGIRALLEDFCARRDLKSLATLLDPYLSDLGTAADRTRLHTALTMLLADPRLPERERVIEELRTFA